MRTLTVRIPETLARSIAGVARRERVSKSELVRRATTNYVAQRESERSFQSAFDFAGGLVGSLQGLPSDLASTTVKTWNEFNLQPGSIADEYSSLW